MSCTIWTPPALASEARSLELALWRAVEAQHTVATRVLVDSQAEQALLEDILEANKPAIPVECRRLDYLLFTPFRYPSGQYGSRFRGTLDPGVWYGAETVQGACAEVGYWRCRFVAASAGLQRLEAVAHTLFRAHAGGHGIDLGAAPFAMDAVHWQHPDDYRACRSLARSARSAELQLIRYVSARDPDQSACVAVLDCRAFGGRAISSRQTWFLSVDARRASWVRSGSRPARPEAREFDYADSA